MISFEQVSRLLQNRQIAGFNIDPLLQSWAGPFGTSNRVITLTATNGLIYLTIIQYDQTNNQIKPPV